MGDLTRIDDVYLWNLTKIGQAFNIHRDTVRKRLTKANVQPKKNLKGKALYALSDVGPALFAGETVLGNDLDPDKLAPKDRKDYYQSENERLKYEKSAALLVPAEEVAQGQATLIKELASAIESGVDRLERTRLFDVAQLEALERDQDMLRNIIHQHMEEMLDQSEP